MTPPSLSGARCRRPAFTEERYYLIHLVRQRVEFHDLVTLVETVAAAYKVNDVLIEDRASLIGRMTGRFALDHAGSTFGPALLLHFPRRPMNMYDPPAIRTAM